MDALREITVKKIALSTMVSTTTSNGYQSNQSLLTLLANGKLEMDKIRTIVSKIEDEESHLLLMRQSIKEENHENLKTTFYILFTTMLFIFILAYFIMRYNFSLLKEFNQTLAQ